MRAAIVEASHPPIAACFGYLASVRTVAGPGWGRAVLRTVARKPSLQLFISPSFAFPPHVPHLSLYK